MILNLKSCAFLRHLNIEHFEYWTSTETEKSSFRTLKFRSYLVAAFNDSQNNFQVSSRTPSSMYIIKGDWNGTATNNLMEVSMDRFQSYVG